MPRRLIALLIALYAIAFAFGAMAAIRWPSLMMVANVMLEDEAAVAGIAGIDWRQLGIIYGAPYFLAALCLYAAALSLGNKKRSARLWYAMGVVAGFPCVFLVDFEPGWWQDPSAGEGAIAGAAAGAVLLGIAVWELCRKQKPKPAQPVQPPENAQVVYVQAPVPDAAKKTKQKVRKPIPAAIARQRAHFAAEGRRMMARQRRH